MDNGADEFSILRLPKQDGQVHLYLGGEVDLTTIPVISTELLYILDRCQKGDKVFIHFEAVEVKRPDGEDITVPGVKYCDEDCVALMFRMWKELQRRDVTIIIIAPNLAIRKSFERRGLDNVFQIVQNEDEIGH